MPTVGSIRVIQPSWKYQLLTSLNHSQKMNGTGHRHRRLQIPSMMMLLRPFGVFRASAITASGLPSPEARTFLLTTATTLTRKPAWMFFITSDTVTSAFIRIRANIPTRRFRPARPSRFTVRVTATATDAEIEGLYPPHTIEHPRRQIPDSSNRSAARRMNNWRELTWDLYHGGDTNVWQCAALDLRMLHSVIRNVQLFMKGESLYESLFARRSHYSYGINAIGTVDIRHNWICVANQQVLGLSKRGLYGMAAKWVRTKLNEWPWYHDYAASRKESEIRAPADTIIMSDWAYPDPEKRRRWNYDNQPHEELWQPQTPGDWEEVTSYDEP